MADDPTEIPPIYILAGGTSKEILPSGFKLSKSRLADNLAQLAPSSPIRFSPCEVGQ